MAPSSTAGRVASCEVARTSSATREIDADAEMSYV